ncbi:hypothetical protein BT96DRAFT_485456 [Gymnopus androsaceus JB14]|uniref:Uncharacterized protein n=1 Tax=Gymnopus androsaceus JB14 TaxID=1447944 RepID=A0A6A4HZM1_9AGAR|nr:hypothetical protein BT96DRAFT_485456 [Gymnopus androsaceus JB14]
MCSRKFSCMEPGCIRMLDPILVRLPTLWTLHPLHGFMGVCVTFGRRLPQNITDYAPKIYGHWQCVGERENLLHRNRCFATRKIRVNIRRQIIWLTIPMKSSSKRRRLVFASSSRLWFVVVFQNRSMLILISSYLGKTMLLIYLFLYRFERGIPTAVQLSDQYSIFDKTVPRRTALDEHL